MNTIEKTKAFKYYKDNKWAFEMEDCQSGDRVFFGEEELREIIRKAWNQGVGHALAGSPPEYRDYMRKRIKRINKHGVLEPWQN